MLSDPIAISNERALPYGSRAISFIIFDRVHRMNRSFIIIGALAAALSVALGAFAAHALKNILAPDRLEVFQTGIRYLMFHSLGLILCGSLADDRLSPGWRRSSGYFFILGMATFSGSLVALGLTGIRLLGAVAPIGGIAFILGWLTLAVSVIRGNRQ